MKGVYFLQISVGRTEKFWESRKLFWQESSANNSITPLTTRLPCPQTTTPPPAREAALPCGVFSFLIFPPSTTTLVCLSGRLLCLAEECSRSGRRQLAWLLPRKSNDIMCFMDNHDTVREFKWVWWNYVPNRHSSFYGYSPQDESISCLQILWVFGTFDVYLGAPWKSVKLQRTHSKCRHQNQRVSQLKYMFWGFFFFFKL